MEQFLKLPQIRISILEKIVSERRKKTQNNNKFSTARLQPALINGQKPFYKFLNHNCTCSYLRCNCKNNSHYHGDKKYPYLLRRQKSSQILTDKKRQYSQGQSQIIRKKKQLRKDNNLSKQAIAEFIYRDKLNKLYERIEKKVLKLIQSKKPIEKECVKKQAIEYMTKKYKKQSKNPSIIDELTIRELDQLVKEIERIVINNQKIPEQKQPIDNLNEMNDQKKRKKLQKSRTEGSLKKNQGEQKKKGKKKKKSKRFPKKPSKQQILSIILKNDQKQNEEFINIILNYDIKIFEETIKKIQQILEEYSDEQKVKNNIIDTVSNLQTKIKASQLDYQSKESKLKYLQKILRFRIDQNVDIQYLCDQDEQFEDNRLTSTLLKSRKTIKSIKKSLKSQKSVRSFVGDDQINLISAFSIKSQSQVSLGQVLEINESLSKQIFEEQKEKNQNYEIKINPPRSSSRIMRENINQKLQQNQPKTQKIVMQHNRQYLRTKTQKNKAKKHYSQEIEFGSKNLLESKREQNKENEKEPIKTSSSAFKKQYSMEMQKLRQNLILEENKIKQFMQHNRETVVKGISRLKEENLQLLIIEATDSLLTKKKKIRKLKQLASSGVIKVDLIAQILAYINLYQVQSNLILRRKKSDPQNFSQQNQAQPEFSVGTLIDRGRLFEDLKFISLNKNYCYGQIEEEQAFNKQLGYGISRMGDFRQYTINQEGKDLNVVQNYLSGPLRKEVGNQLIQKQMGQQGHFLEINLLEYDRETKKRGIKKKHSKLRKKMRKLTQQNEQQGSSHKKNRFLLTQNTLIL